MQDLDWDSLFYKPGLPEKPDFDTELVDQCYQLADDWQALNEGKDGFKPKASDIQDFTANQSVVFLERVQTFSKPLSADLVDLMGKTYAFADSKNVEITSRFFVVGLQARDESVYQLAADLLGQVGRMKFVRPIFKELMRCDINLAKRTLEKNRDFYHPICRQMLEKLLEKHEKESK